tara:strand:- start:126 stop:638 length:513 start_codon:yes stop_codon:yes gene_type:complete
MKQFVGYIANKMVKSIPRNKKVFPTIKSVKPFTEKKADSFAGIKSKTPEDRANVIRRRESIKRMDQLDDLKKKRKKGIEAGKEIKKMVDTKKAKNIGGTVFHKSVPERKATGGRVGRRFGSPKPKTNVQKIKETFGPKKKNLSPKQMKIAKLAGNPNKIDGADFKKLRNR